MSYEIRYTKDGSRKYLSGKKPSWNFLLAAIGTVFAVVGLYRLLLDGQLSVWSFLLPGSDAGTGEAVQSMLDGIRSGEPVGRAVTAFCMEIINDAR